MPSPHLPEPVDHLTREELLARVAELSEELQLSRAFADTPEVASGDARLMWRGRNRFLAERIFPVSIRIDASKSFRPERGAHRVIDGDNLSVMTSLLAEFRGGRSRGFDVIYMDPPYNTGGEIFPYSDDFNLRKSEVAELRRAVGRAADSVSLDDPTRHTKWINHMAPRLWAAKKLLKTTGLIIISIDEHELPRLWLLMEELFGDKNRIATLVWDRSRKNDANYVSEGHEYMLIWARNKLELDALIQTKGKWRVYKPGLEEHMDLFRSLVDQYGDDYRAISKALKASVKGIRKDNAKWTVRQYVHVDERSIEKGPFKEEDPSWPGPGGPRYPVVNPNIGQEVTIPANGWRLSNPEDFQQLIDEDRVQWKGTLAPKIKRYLLEGREQDVFTSVVRKEARQSTILSRAIFGPDKAYKHPKDHQLLASIFNLVTWGNKKALILDPYAGSGTTGHAVIQMNAEDGGERTCVLIEGGYSSKRSQVKPSEYTDKITAERLRRIITGEYADGKSHDSFDTGFSYYRARDKISSKAIMESTREHLADIILQIVEDDTNKLDCRVDGHKFLIGRTRLGFGIALVWDPKISDPTKQQLTWKDLEQVLAEAEKAEVQAPIHIYACGNTAPLDDTLYRFHQIPNAILARLGMMDSDYEPEEYVDEATEFYEEDEGNEEDPDGGEEDF